MFPWNKQTEYAVEDADITFQLAQHFRPELKEANTEELFNEIEIPLLHVLADMEQEGINLDKAFLNSLAKDLDNDIKNLESKIYKEAGEEFNIASPKQLGEILFDKLKLVDKPKKTKTGQYSTAEDVLSYLAKDHEIIQSVLDYPWPQQIKKHLCGCPTGTNRGKHRQSTYRLYANRSRYGQIEQQQSQPSEHSHYERNEEDR